MKQKYFYLIGLLAIVMGVFVLGSCSKDDDDDNPIEGTWQYNKSKSMRVYTYTFTSDGNFTYIVIDTERSTSITNAKFRSEYSGTYTIAENVLTMHTTRYVSISGGSVKGDESKDRTENYNFSVSGNELHLKELDCSKCEEEVFIKQ